MGRGNSNASARPGWPNETSGAHRVRQAHELGGLVERLACCVIYGFPENLVAANAIYPHELRVAT